MKIAILEADHVANNLAAEHGDYPSMFKDLLLSVDDTLTFSVYSVIDNVFPSEAELKNHDGFLITGSKYSCYERLDWIQRLSDLIQLLYKDKMPLVGICFGHQLIAQALGGYTEKSSSGWGVGIYKSELYKQPEWMLTPVESERFNLLVSHQDQVTRLPVGATLLGGNEFCPNGMYQLGESILTFQGHPEFSKPYCQALMTKRRDILGEAVFQTGIESLAGEEHGNLVARWILEFISSADQ